MSFTPILGTGGYTGWALLQKTQEKQKLVFNNQKQVQRDEAYFKEKIKSVTTPEDLVKDRRLLRIALEAHGLGDDVNNRFFIRKVLEEGTLDPKALAMKLSDTRYRELANSFGFHLGVPNTKLSTFPEKILSQWRERQFEVAVGQQNESYRLAMNAERELKKLADSSASDSSKWFSVMGQLPLRKVFETAFNLPTAFGTLDIDRQKKIFEEKAGIYLGNKSVNQFSDPEAIEKLTKTYLLKSQATSGIQGYSSARAALTLLGGG